MSEEKKAAKINDTIYPILSKGDTIMNEERKTNNKDFRCLVMEQKHIVCWEGNRYGLYLPPACPAGKKLSAPSSL